MCLSTVYRDARQEENVLCKFVATIEAQGERLKFTDVLGAETEIEGHLVSADLTNGTVIVQVA